MQFANVSKSDHIPFPRITVYFTALLRVNKVTNAMNAFSFSKSEWSAWLAGDFVGTRIQNGTIKESF